MNDIVNYLVEAAAAVSKFVSENRGLIVGIGMAVAALIAVGAAIFAVGAVSYIAGAALVALGTLIGILTSPITLVIAAGGLLLYAFITWTQAGKAMASEMTSAFSGMLGTAKGTFKGIADALASGNITLAASIMWAGLRVAWVQGCDLLKGVWDSALIYMEAAFDKFFGTIRGVMQKLSNSIATMLANTGVFGKVDPDVMAQVNNAASNQLDAGMRQRANDRQNRLNGTGKPSPQLAALQADLAALLAQAAALAGMSNGGNGTERAKERGKEGVNAAVNLATEMKSPDAQGVNSTTAASTIARAYNANSNIPQQQLAATTKILAVAQKQEKHLAQIAKQAQLIKVKEIL